MSTTSAERPNTRKARAAETRRRLVQAAVDQFSERHYDDVAVSHIAESAGVAHGLLFHYFDSKRGIYLEAMHEAARALEGRHDFTSFVPAGCTIEDRVRTVTESRLQVVAKVPGASQEAFRKAASAAETGCPISKLFKAKITMDAKLEP